MHQLRSMIDLDQRTVAGTRVGDEIGDVEVDADVIHPVDDPLARHPGIVNLRGSLAPDGALAKRTVADDGIRRFTGPAKVFHSRQQALTGVRAFRLIASRLRRSARREPLAPAHGAE